ncbi:MAG: cbb3-type cytochrome c oxidase subunit I [Acidobacteria bacterium]|nr:cbb3-type cytochrome c oxidase subunit I [Acidobacteriota bacterium]
MSGAIRTEARLIRAHGYAAIGGLLLSALFGLAVSLKFHAPAFLNGQAWLTWGRLRYDHTQGILYAWLGNAFLAFLYYALPRLARRPVTSARLGWALFIVWNVIAVLGGWTLVLAGVSQPLEWAEFPLAIAGVIECAWALIILQFGLPLLRRGAEAIYVSGWYLLGGVLFTSLAYPVGNLVPRFLPGAMGAGFSGLWIHDAVGLFITPFALAIAYFVIPAVSRRPIYSHFYSMVGFWLLFLVYPLNGIHHYLYSALPMSSQHAAEVASIYQGLDVILVVTNLLLSIRASEAWADVPLRFVWTSVMLYLVVSVQGSLQAVMSFNRYIHFTDWVIGHSHLAMIGFASFAAMGALAHIWQQTPGARFHPGALAWSYWLLTVGLCLMVADLTAAGLVQAGLWRGTLPWIESVRVSRPYWIFRTLDGLVLLGGFVAFGLSLLRGPARRAQIAEVDADSHEALPRRSWLGSAYAATFGAGLLFFVVSFVALGILPALRLRAEIRESTPPAAHLALSPAERRGRAIYAREGCAYCHTQQVRETRADMLRFGAPTAAWETQREFPQMWGTRRVGPDLARESTQRRADWQLVHLFDPRYTAPDSVMPAYPWMFDGAPDRPGRDALDLAAYLGSLGRAAGSGAGPAMCVAPSSPGMAKGDPGQGRRVFQHNCAGCHGEGGVADSPGGQALSPPAFDLAAAAMADSLVWRALRQGVPGTSMPSWAGLPAADLRNVAAYTLQLGDPGDLPAAERRAPPDVLLEAGKRVYDMHCTACHGDTGAGDGPEAGRHEPRPAAFLEMQPSYPLARRVIHSGVAGTAMSAWPLLTPAEIQAVTTYIRSLYRGPQRGRPVEVRK